MPANRGLALDWINARLDPWEANAAAIGLELTDPAALVALAGAADEARVAADAARSASKAATQAWYDKADAAMDFARELILKIKAKAATDPQVYVLAQVSARANPGETPPPESPSPIVATLIKGGPLRLDWKCTGPRGTFYIVKRKLEGENAFSIIATVTDKVFTDNTLPRGIDQVTYQVDAQQQDKVTAGDVLPVQLGSGNGSQSGEAAA
ncbi:hypothetical protein AY599_28265 [Leptolyngbya valderiana BDU 20041]|nr:hypothetical protein AY599_28265 [Leptolyngbya valderiana BDU 20041]